MPDADIGSLAEQSGMDVSRCEFCDELLDDSQSWKRGLDGAGAHLDCIDGYLHHRPDPGDEPLRGDA